MQEFADELSPRIHDACFGSSRSLRHVANSNGANSSSSSSRSCIGGVTYYDADFGTPSTVTAASSMDFDVIGSSHDDVTHSLASIVRNRLLTYRVH